MIRKKDYTIMTPAAAEHGREQQHPQTAPHTGETAERKSPSDTGYE